MLPPCFMRHSPLTARTSLCLLTHISQIYPRPQKLHFMKWQLMTCAASLEDEINKRDWNNSERFFILKYKQKLINYSSCLSHTAGSDVDTGNHTNCSTFISMFSPRGGMLGGVLMLGNDQFESGGGGGETWIQLLHCHLVLRQHACASHFMLPGFIHESNSDVFSTHTALRGMACVNLGVQIAVINIHGGLWCFLTRWSSSPSTQWVQPLPSISPFCTHTSLSPSQVMVV